MNNDSSNSINLKFLNLFIGMCQGAEGVPQTLRQLGFRVRGIEFPFAVGTQTEVVPELILYSRQIWHSLLFEWKSGQNFEDEQLARYPQITIEDLVERVFLPRKCAENFDVTLVGLAEHMPRLLLGVRGKYDFPTLEIAE